MEIWAEIPESGWWVSNMGRICGPRGLVQPYEDQAGYQIVSVRGLPTRVHRLVLTVFMGAAADNVEAAHWNGDPGDNRLVNLRWATSSDNGADRRRHISAIKEIAAQDRRSTVIPGRNRASSTYGYRNPDKRRAYQRDLMRRRRAAGRAA